MAWRQAVQLPLTLAKTSPAQKLFFSNKIESWTHSKELQNRENSDTLSISHSQRLRRQGWTPCPSDKLSTAAVLISFSVYSLDQHSIWKLFYSLLYVAYKFGNPQGSWGVVHTDFSFSLSRLSVDKTRAIRLHSEFDKPTSFVWPDVLSLPASSHGWAIKPCPWNSQAFLMDRSRSLVPVATVLYKLSVFCCTLSLEEEIILSSQQCQHECLQKWDCFAVWLWLAFPWAQDPADEVSSWLLAAQAWPWRLEFPRWTKKQGLQWAGESKIEKVKMKTSSLRVEMHSGLPFPVHCL